MSDKRSACSELFSMPEYYIDPNWLGAIKHKSLFYPAADNDYSDALNVFRNGIDRFLFCDNHYPVGMNLAPAIRGNGGVKLISVTKEGEINANMESRPDAKGKRYRFLLPSKLVETYQRGGGGTFTVIRRRGFGQFALLKEFADRSIGVFMHRGDSLGEGGSNMWFLANKPKRYEPVGNLFDKLAPRLTDKALIVSDGSNTTIATLSKFHRKEVGGCDAFEHHQKNTEGFNFGGFRWTCVGWLPNRYGPTLVWGVVRNS